MLRLRPLGRPAARRQQLARNRPALRCASSCGSRRWQLRRRRHRQRQRRTSAGSLERSGSSDSRALYAQCSWFRAETELQQAVAGQIAQASAGPAGDARDVPPPPPARQQALEVAQVLLLAARALAGLAPLPLQGPGFSLAPSMALSGLQPACPPALPAVAAALSRAARSRAARRDPQPAHAARLWHSSRCSRAVLLLQ